MAADHLVLAASPPAFDTRFIGRQRELTSLRGQLLSGAGRLITLVGVGGSGKTRLAAELATLLVGVDADARFGDGVVWVDLAQVAEPGALGAGVAEAFGLHVGSDIDPTQVLVRTLAERQLLLIMDNAEDLTASCRCLIDDLLAGCPGLVVVATSRVPLRSPDEHLIRVQPLDVQAGDGGRSEAAELFYDRAGRVLPEYSRLADDVAEVNAVCERLDGVPLAIELAAPWIRTLSSRDLLVEIDRSAALLAATDPTASDRHRSMHAVLDSTWGAMDGGCRAALRGLSIFVGGFSGEAARAVAEATVTTLEALTELSLIRRLPDTERGTWYGMHELVRTYAADMLQHRPQEADRVRARHLSYFLDLFERARAEEDTPNELRWIREVRRQMPNAGAALHWARNHGRAEQALRLTAALANFWGGASASGRHRAEFDAALALPWDPASAIQASARAHLSNAAGWAAMTRRDWEAARCYFEEAAARYQQLGNQVLHALALSNVGWAVVRGPDPTFGPGYNRQALAICRRISDPLGIAWSTFDLGATLFVAGEDTEAERLVRDGLRQLTDLGVSYGVCVCQVSLGHAYRRQGRWTEAIEAYLAALREQQRGLHRTHGADILAGLGVAALAQDRPDCAARLFGASRTWGETHSDMSTLNPSRDLDGPRAMAERRRGDVEWAWHYAAGGRLTTERAMAMAESDADELLLHCRAPLPFGLTARELQVLRLVADGLSDSAIAEKLALSPRTVQVHVRSLCRKFGVNTRTAAVYQATNLGVLASP